jgi:zinc transport system substrate-binding protein
MLKPLITLILSMVIATPAMTKPLHIVTDIAPIYSLVAQVTGTTDNLTLLLNSGASPHDFALKPSQAKALQKADIIIYTGLELTPWMEKPLQTLAANSTQISLLKVLNTVHHEMRDSNVFGTTHDHDHDHEQVDPHAWMDPQNAIIWLDHIADKLGAQNIESKQLYKTNSERAKLEIHDIEEQVILQLSKHAGDKVLFFHDAYQYFEHRFKLNAVGAVTLADDAKVTPKQLKSVQNLFIKHDIQCVLTEPTTDANWINTLTGQQISQAKLDPLGSQITVNEAFYGKLIQQTADQITKCLNP